MRRALPLIVAVLAFFAAGIAWVVLDRRASQHAYDAFSSANTSDEGLSLAYRYLRAQQRRVAMLTRPMASQPIEPNAVLFRVHEEFFVFDAPIMEVEDEFADRKKKKKDDKQKDAKKKDAKTDDGPKEKSAGPLVRSRRTQPLLSFPEQEWVRRGGRLILAAGSGMGRVETRYFEKPVARKVFPLWDGIDSITTPAKRGFAPNTLPPRMHALYANGEYVVLARERVGSGELFILSVPELLQNRHLGSGRSLELLLALAGTNRPVYFDELVHGVTSDNGPLALMKEWRLGPALLLAALTAALLFWRNGKRVGPPEDDFRDTRSEAIDLVQSLGALYQGATTDAESLALYHDALVRAVAMQSGLRGEALHRRVAELTDGFAPPAAQTGLSVPHMPAAEFQRQLAIINEGFSRLATARAMA